MLNYEVDPELLMRYVPSGTEIDSFAGKTYISLVGFRFLDTKLLGMCVIPFHSDFDEVNLRFYVRRREGVTIRRGVVFIREIVPKWGIAQVARLSYGENYARYPMKHFINVDARGSTVEYQWQVNHQWCRLYGHASQTSIQPGEGSLEQFITEHYWGYSKRSRDSLEYEVAHVPWNISSTEEANFEGEGSLVFGAEFGRTLQSRPASAFIADGSKVSVFAGRRFS
jgi:uncharacterized protein YqjF (DUF2071 family)